MAGALEGVRIIDLTTMVSGPMASMILADQGAQVIKIESPGGDRMRALGPGIEAPGITGMSGAFLSCNRGKKSVALDLKQEEGRKVLRDLVASADVFVQNFRPGAIERMGFGEEDVRAIKPDIVFVSISGFGETGPNALKRVYDPIIQALSGAPDVQADRVSHRPQMFQVIIADKVTALTAAQAISAALFARQRSGEGQHVRLSMLDSLVAFFWPEQMATLNFVGQEADPASFRSGLDLIYETRDGYITAAAVSDAEWKGLCEVLGCEDWIADPRFSTAAARMANVSVRKELTATQIAGWDTQDLLERLEAADVPAAPLLTRLDLIEDAQIKANGTLVVTDYDGLGRVRQPRPAARFSETPGVIAQSAPLLGQHNREVLESLGYAPDAIERLEDQGILRAS
jgi:crotonobetainyl-CoA:carnitine CoA-transferase CaiB-like acyl-CoA transferase